MAMEAHFTSNPNISSPSHSLSLPAMLTSSHVRATSTVLLFPPIRHFSTHHRRGSSFLTTTTTSPLRSSRNRRRIGLKVVASIGPSIGNPLTKVLEKPIAVKATVTVQVSVGGILSNLSLTRGLDDITDMLGKSILLELVSAELDPNTGKEKPTITAYAHKTKQDRDDVLYEANFAVPGGFGDIGAVIVENEHHTEMFLKGIVLTGYGVSPVNVVCNSWVHAKSDNSQKRVFFANKAYLPSQTPSGLRQLRQSELSTLRGNGQGERKVFERIYDYDVYNDLGDPDNKIELKRPVLGGKEHPYPRRCRTGRPMSKADPKSESRGSFWYVPRDESFSEIKQATFSIKTLRSVLHAVVPTLEANFLDPEFAYYTEIDKLFDEGVELQAANTDVASFKSLIPRLLKSIDDRADSLLLFETPEMIDRDKFAWFRDEEFSRQTLAGLNPLGLELVKEFPFVSKLDPTIYGPAESKITKEIIEREINTVMTVEEAIKQKKLFILDYHDLLLPYVHKIRELKGTTLYGSRTVFFLMPNGTLKPLAIELTRPASPAKPQWSEVFTHCTDATGTWLWRLAKVHVCAHDSGIHQLVSHWLRTHCCTEPYIIAANRQLSAMHPIFRLLHPHFRYTMEINALAREALINAGGIIESCFSPLKYSLEICSVAYDKLWRFDAEALPADLIKRGMAEEDPTAEHGVKLTIKDYPYANDGLLVWSAIKEWVEEYISHYYSNDDEVNSDREIQSWWTEVRTKGHADKKDEPWWPVLNTKKNLCHVLTTIIWVASGHHAAVNFGQYHYAGYFPNRPTIARINMPCEEGNEAQFTRFLERPERLLLETFPSQSQATKVMTILDVLSNHSIDEEYIGDLPENSHPDDPAIKAAYEKFTGKLMEIEGIIDSRNLDRNLLNRHGAGVVPYELLKPLSKPGVTGKGVPNSISI